MSNLIHPMAVIEGDVELGDGNLKIGDRNWIGAHVTIGTL